MKTPDEEISNRILAKLVPLHRWNTTTINKIAAWVKDGNITADDLIFLLENKREVKSEVAE